MKNLISTCFVVFAFAAPSMAQDAATASPEQQIQPPVAATEPAPPAPKPTSMSDMRHHIYVMEGALARAVDYGAKTLNREILAVMPGVFMLEGEARARGVHLDGYGVFFDVRVPMMRQSMVWSLRMMMEQDNSANEALIDELRRTIQRVTDPGTRASMEKALRQLERQNAAALPRMGSQVTPGVVVSERPSMPAVGAATAAGLATDPSAPAPARPESLWARDPDRAYTEAVTSALVNAMIDYSTPMVIAPDQWLTVAARDDEGSDSLAPQDPLVEFVTMIYRIKGSDLQLYRSGKIDRDEVRRRVQLSQF